MKLVEPNQEHNTSYTVYYRSFMRDPENHNSRFHRLNLSDPAIAPIVSRLIQFRWIVKNH